MLIKTIAVLLAVFACTASIAFAHEVELMTPQQSLSSVTVDSQHGLFAVASWCPYSVKFVELLNDPEIKTYLQGTSLQFALTNEWPIIEDRLNQKGQMYRLTSLKEESGHELVYRPDFLKTLPGNHFFIPYADQIETIKGFPSAYSIAEEGFKVDVEVWLKLNTEIPEAFLNQKLHDYGLE